MVVASADVRLPRFLRREAGAEVDRLYRRHSEEVSRYALLVLRSRTDAEDVTQTVFLRALRAIERGEQVRTPRNWLIKIAHNECRRLLASRKLHIELPDEIAVEPVEQGRAEELRLAMAALPEHQRQALVLRELEGRSYVEIARTLDLSESAVETLIFRARRALREQIENAMSCEEFATVLDDPSARSRVRAHARVCPGCATLDRRSRGRKSALKRIASALGLPGWGTWWGAKVAAVALTTATVAAVAVPHDGTRPNVPNSGLKLVPLSPQVKLESPGSGIRFKSLEPKQTHASSVVAAPKKASVAAVSGTPAATPPTAATPPPPMPDPPKPGEPPLPPAAAVPEAVVPGAAVPELPLVLPEQTVTVRESVLPAVPELPAVNLPTVSVPLPEAQAPTANLPVEAPKVILP
jgi:RNA polymerase sigma factor (sigma-70 family)